MKLSLKKEELLSYVSKQINNIIPDGKIITNTILRPSFNLSLERLEFCFSQINLKYCRENNQVVFNHLYSDQYSMFLYFLSNSAYKNNLNKNVCEKIYCLNKCLNAIDIYFEVELPNIFLLVHPLGTVLGIPTINIGERQHKRLNSRAIKNLKIESLNKYNVDKFLNDYKQIKKKYFGKGNTDKRFIQTINKNAFWKISTQKYYADIV
jgi:hypothetical protein